MSRSRIPPLLQPYVALPAPQSLVLLTSVLGASTNWLLIRYLCGALSPVEFSRRDEGGEAGNARQEEGEVAVVLVSWLRDLEFWKTETRRAGGLDLARLAQQKRFAFVDGLTNLANPTTEDAPPSRPAPGQSPVQPARHTPLPVRGPRSVTPRSPAAQTTTPSPAQTGPTVTATASSIHSQTAGQPPFRLTSIQLPAVEQVIQQAIDYVAAPSGGAETPKRVLLVLDSPDLLLALAHVNPSGAPTVTATSLCASILQLRHSASSTVITLAADSPLVSTSPASTPLELSHAALITSLAHVASYTLSLRLLDTGFAADVSGVLRITKGDTDGSDAEEEQGNSSNFEEKEVLYYVGGDGSVRVFERGAGVGAG